MRSKIELLINHDLLSAIEDRADRAKISVNEAIRNYIQAGLEAERMGKIGPVLEISPVKK